jgi:Flp pilus assembly protein TadG
VGGSSLKIARNLRKCVIKAHLVSDSRGVAALEFALVAAPLFALILAVLETSLVFFAQQNLETAGEMASRQILTGTAQNAGTTQAQFKTAACAKLPTFLECSKLIVDVQTATSFATVDTTRPNATVNASTGAVTSSNNYATVNPGDIVIFRLMYPWSNVMGPLGFDLSNISGGKRLLVATSVFKAEPYQ